MTEVSPLGAITRKTYNADGSLATSTDSNGQVTAYSYYGPSDAAAGKLMMVTNPHGKTITYTYSALGQVTGQTGTATYQVAYQYDGFGARIGMTTWQDANTPCNTTWTYQAGTGLLVSKTDAAGKSTTYAYDALGQVTGRTWARGTITNYSYSSYGDLTGITYSDGTPGVTLSGYDRLGRPTSVSQVGIGTENLAYQPGNGALASRVYDGGHTILPGIGINYSSLDAAGRPTGFAETSDTSRNVVYVYESNTGGAGRLASVTDGSQPPHAYTYLPNSSLVSAINSGTAASPWFRESRSYDTSGRLTGIRSDNVGSAHGLSVHAYTYDALGRRTLDIFQDGSFKQFAYDDLSQVTSVTRRTANGTGVPQLGATYSYDGIGNRLSSTSPVLGNHNYSLDALNRYATITTGNTRTAVGRAPTDWNVLVNNTATSRIGEIYSLPLTAANSGSPVWQTVTTQRDTGVPTITKNFWYASQTFSPQDHDDGNLLNDGRWVYTWDAENRLIQMETTLDATRVGHPYTKLAFVYDWQGRRIARNVWKGGTPDAPVFRSSHRWLYDGWNVVTEYLAASDTSNTLTKRKAFTGDCPAPCKVPAG